MDLLPMLAAAAGAGGAESDDDFANTVLLLHGDGTNGAQNNTFLDSSTNNFTITRNGNTTQGSFSPFSKPDGRWGNYFDGSGDYLTLADNAAFDVGSGDFTVEYWFYWTGTGQQRHYGQADSGGSVASISILSGTTSTNKLISRAAVGGSLTDCTSTADLPANSFVHIAFVRDGTTLRQYINGVQDGTASISTSTINNSANQFSIGRTGQVNGDYTSGYISNFRFVKGTCLYPSGTAFTPSTTPLTAISGTSLLTCQSNRFKDNSTNNFAITAAGNVKVTPFSPFPITTEYSPSVNGGSGYFDGSGDYLSFASNSAFAFGTGDFTVEAWVYPLSRAAVLNICGTRGPAGTVNGWNWGILTDGSVQMYSNGAIANTGANTVPLNAWTLITFTRSSGTITGYINGVSKNTAANTQDFSIQDFWIGITGGSAEPFNGYIASLRLLKGTSITPSVTTAPFTNVTNTSLLCNLSNAGIFDNTGFNVLETVGNAQIDTTTKKYGTGSLEFDGNGDYLKIPADQKENLRFGTGDFTIEFWAWKSANGVSGFDTVISVASDGNANGGFILELSSSRGFAFIYDAANRISSNFNPNDSAWHHYALVRNGSTFAMYKDGVQLTTGTLTPTLGVTGNAEIGSAAGGQIPFNGFIDDLRITKGVARYTSNFTPPDKAFPNIGA